MTRKLYFGIRHSPFLKVIFSCNLITSPCLPPLGLRNLLWGTTSNGNDGGTIIPPPPASTGFSCMAHVIELAKSVANRVWADAPLASIRQLPDVGKNYASQLAGAGVVSLRDIEKVGPRRIEQVMIV